MREHGLTEAEKLELDELVYGFSVIKAGRRVPPWEVSAAGKSVASLQPRSTSQIRSDPEPKPPETR